MPWKFCPNCKQISYSAATNYESWLCPYCSNDLYSEPEYDIETAKSLKREHLDKEKPEPNSNK